MRPLIIINSKSFGAQTHKQTGILENALLDRDNKKILHHTFIIEMSPASQLLSRHLVI